LTKPGCGFIFRISVEIVKNLRYSAEDVGYDRSNEQLIFAKIWSKSPFLKSCEKGKANNPGGIKWLV